MEKQRPGGDEKVPNESRRKFLQDAATGAAGGVLAGFAGGALTGHSLAKSQMRVRTDLSEPRSGGNDKQYRDVLFRTEPKAFERQATPLDITQYVDDLVELTEALGKDLKSDKNTSEAWAAIHEKTNAFLQTMTQSQGIQNPLPSIDAEAMHEAVVHAMRRYPDNDLLIGALEHIRRQISSVVIRRELGVVPPIAERQKSEA